MNTFSPQSTVIMFKPQRSGATRIGMRRATRNAFIHPRRGMGPLFDATQSNPPEIPNQKVVHILNELLADMVELHLRTNQIHWDLCVSKFSALHSLCEHLGRQLDDAADKMATRVSQRGGTTFDIERPVVWRSCAPPNPTDGSAVNSRLKDLFLLLCNFTSALGKAKCAVLELRDYETAQLLAAVEASSKMSLWTIQEYSWLSVDMQLAGLIGERVAEILKAA